MKTIDRLTTLRSEISDSESVVARLLDILIDDRTKDQPSATPTGRRTARTDKGEDGEE